MAAAAYPLRKVQVGHEAVNGTLVVATQQLVGDFTLAEQIDRHFEENPRGVFVPVTAGGIDLRKGALLTGDQELTYEEIMYPLQAGLLKDAVPADLGGPGPYAWTFTPDWATINALNALTFEYVIDDGSTQHYEREFGFAICRSFGIDFAFNEIARLRTEYFGRATQTSTFTAALTPLTGRSPVASNLLTVAIDDSWANLGNTQKSVLVRSATFDVVTGREPDYTLDGRTDLDMVGIRTARAGATLSLVMEHSADAATEIGKWRSGAQRYVQLSVTDGTKIILIDLSCKYMSEPAFTQDEDVEIATMELGLEWDATASEALDITVTNNIATLP